MYKRWTNAQVSTSINYINCNPRPELLHLRNTILGSDREMEREKEREEEEEEEEIALLSFSLSLKSLRLRWRIGWPGKRSVSHLFILDKLFNCDPALIICSPVW